MGQTVQEIILFLVTGVFLSKLLHALVCCRACHKGFFLKLLALLSLIIGLTQDSILCQSF